VRGIVVIFIGIEIVSVIIILLRNILLNILANARLITIIFCNFKSIKNAQAIPSIFWKMLAIIGRISVGVSAISGINIQNANL
jgi:hypothetical protein